MILLVAFEVVSDENELYWFLCCRFFQNFVSSQLNISIEEVIQVSITPLVLEGNVSSSGSRFKPTKHSKKI